MDVSKTSAEELLDEAARLPGSADEQRVALLAEAAERFASLPADDGRRRSAFRKTLSRQLLAALRRHGDTLSEDAIDRLLSAGAVLRPAQRLLVTSLAASGLRLHGSTIAAGTAGAVSLGVAGGTTMLDLARAAQGVYSPALPVSPPWPFAFALFAVSSTYWAIASGFAPPLSRTDEADTHGLHARVLRTALTKGIAGIRRLPSSARLSIGAGLAAFFASAGTGLLDLAKLASGTPVTQLPVHEAIPMLLFDTSLPLLAWGFNAAVRAFRSMPHAADITDGPSAPAPSAVHRLSRTAIALAVLAGSVLAVGVGCGVFVAVRQTNGELAPDVRTPLLLAGAAVIGAIPLTIAAITKGFRTWHGEHARTDRLGTISRHLDELFARPEQMRLVERVAANVLKRHLINTMLSDLSGLEPNVRGERARAIQPHLTRTYLMPGSERRKTARMHAAAAVRR